MRVELPYDIFRELCVPWVDGVYYNPFGKNLLRFSKDFFDWCKFSGIEVPNSELADDKIILIFQSESDAALFKLSWIY